jgi:hypothetical protein
MSRLRCSSLLVAAPIFLAMAFLAPNAAAAAVPTLELRDGRRAVLSLQNAKPGDSATGCVRLTYRGSTPARVLLYGTTSGTGFDRYLDLTVARGASCGRGQIVYDGTLARFPDAPGSAIRERWSPDESHAYRFEVSVRDDNDAQGLTARQTFTWRAQGDVEAPAASPPQTTTPGGSLAKAPGVEGLRRLLREIVRVAAEVGKRSAFPSALMVLVGAFLALQNRIDRRDPKLALAPVHPTPDLPFEGSAE